MTPNTYPAYSTEDIEALEKDLDWIKAPRSIYTYDRWYVIIKIDGEIKKFYKTECDSQLREYIMERSAHVLSCPLEDVPLHLNKSQKLAKWRLKIAK